MRTLILAAAIATVAAPAIARPLPADTCIRHYDLYNWSSPNDKTLILENNRHKKVLAHLIGACTGLSFNQTIAIRSPGASQLSCIERGDFVTTRSFGSGIRSSCAIGSLEPYNGDLQPQKADWHGERERGSDRGSDY